MKKLIINSILMVVFLNAGGDIAPIEIPTVVPEPIGLKYSVKSISETSTLNIRVGPSSKYKKIGELAYNASGFTFEKCEYYKKNELWCQLSSPFLEINGWVSKKYVYDTNSNEQDEEYIGLHFIVNQFNQQDESLVVKTGRGTEFPTIDKLDYNRDDIIVSTCQKNKKDEEWCWINYGEQKLGWVLKEHIAPKIDSCYTAIRFSNDKKIMKELCQKAGERFEKKGQYDNAISYYMYAEKIDKIIEIYRNKKFIKRTDSYKIIAYAYKKNGDTKTFEKILSNHNKWNSNIGWGDYQGEENTKLYLKWYPEEKEKIFPSLDYSDDEGDIAPVVVPAPIIILSSEEQEKLITPCLKIAEKEKLTLDELYQGCYQPLTELRFVDISENKDKYKLVTIAMVIDEVRPEAMIFANYLKKIESSLLSNLYYLEYSYLKNYIQKENVFKNTLYRMVDLSFFYGAEEIDKKTITDQFLFFKSLLEKLSSGQGVLKAIYTKVQEIENRYQEMTNIGVCLLSAYKKKDKKPFFRTLNPIYYDSDTNTIKVSNLIEYYLMPLIVQYVPKYYFKNHFNNIKENIENDTPTEIIDNIEEKFQDSKDTKEAFYFSFFDKTDIENSIKYIDVIKDNNATSVYNHYLNTKLQPLLINSDSMTIQDDEITMDIVSNDMIKFMILSCKTKNEDKYSQKECINKLIDEIIKPMKELYTLDNKILATLYFAKENYLQANYYIKEFLEEKNFDAKSVELAQHYQQLAVGYYKLKKFEKSFKYLKKSLSIFKLYSKSIKYCDTLKLLPLLGKNIEIDQAYLKEQQIELLQCKIYNNLSDEDYIKIESQILSATFMNLVNSPCFDMKSLLEGEVPKEFITDGIEASTKMNGKYSLITSKLYRQKAESLFNEEKYKQAHKYIKESFEIVLYIRDVKFPYMTYLQKVDFLNEVKKYIALYLKTSFHATKDSNENTQTINNWLNYKGSIFDSENAIATLYSTTTDKAFKEKIDELLSNNRRLAKLYQNIPEDKEREEWRATIKDVEDNITALTNAIAEKAQSFKETQGLKNINYQDISANLKENELYIDYAKGGEYYYVFTLDQKNNISFYQIEEKKSQRIDQLITEYREDIQKIIESKGSLSINSKDKASELHNLLIKEPLSKEVKPYSSLIISPDGALRLLPFEALYDEKSEKYLIESKEIRYIPSGKELVRLYRYASKNSNQTPQAIIISNPNFEAINTIKVASTKKVARGITPYTNQSGIIKSLFTMYFEPLEGTKLEAANISNILQLTTTVTRYQEDNASETSLMSVISPNILHIATHGFFINDDSISNPMLKSGIALSGANESAKSKQGEGIVTALKLSGLKLKGTDLVVLSACKTGVVDTKDTDSISGLGKAFIQAGAKDIVMSLWSVDDNATKELMTSFYQKMQTNSNYSKALKEAKLEMIANNKHPFFWAGFLLSGL